MKQNAGFLVEYFIQTRREVDNEKSSRDAILNFVILAIGALGFAVFQNENAQALITHPLAFILEISILIAITSLFWLRRKKLQQIADRWFVLEGIISSLNTGLDKDQTLEAIVFKGLVKTRYTKKDAVLCICISAPIYGLMLFSIWEVMPISIVILSIAIVVAGHIIISWLLMAKPFNRPEPLESYMNSRQTPGFSSPGDGKGKITQH